jgi:hypothetical protein
MHLQVQSLTIQELQNCFKLSITRSKEGTINAINITINVIENVTTFTNVRCLSLII